LERSSAHELWLADLADLEERLQARLDQLKQAMDKEQRSAGKEARKLVKQKVAAKSVLNCRLVHGLVQSNHSRLMLASMQQASARRKSKI